MAYHKKNPDITYQNNNSKSVRADYIYPKTHKKIKKDKSRKTDLPLLVNI